MSWNPSHFWGYVPASLLVVPNALLVLLDLLLIQEALVGGQICHFFSFQSVHNLAASNVAVHNIVLFSWQKVRNWNVLEEEVFAGGWELFNGLAMNREAVDEKYFSFLQAAF